ncbi:MAG: anthranilate phosphoribosyltransferase [Pseudomonadota bacterium]|nr:anthranilate phosphoribosyltransferase [Pseudomonadota bacterium]MDP1905380.1 anthranilate phosphoribosyltransferase [Pseudomonadota bacterium]MDP2354164.1 anthranilate phosphoribosyltransferase [Pseudomonadota bacterium]
MNYAPLLNRLVARQDLAREDMLDLMRAIMTGELTAAQIAGAIIALRCKGETVTELAAAASVMRELSTKVSLADVPHLVDTCGTGGDGAHTFNISTAAAFVAAACGARVAKHGGRSVSSKSGSADVLEALGVNVNLPPEKVAQAVREIGVGFMFAPNHHSAMKHAAPVRRELGVRTLFNLLGPMTNPAGAPHQVMGVFARELTRTLAEVLRELGSRHVLVVHAADGLDEISLAGETWIAELRDGAIHEYTVTPEQFGFERRTSDYFEVVDVAAAKDRLLLALSGKACAEQDIVALNAGAALLAADRADSLAEGVVLAREALASGAALARLEALIAFA